MPNLPRKADDERHLVFVYGTLMRGCTNHKYMAGQAFLGEARTVPGYRLHRISDYPGLIAAHDASTSVHGELWSVDRSGLQDLHRLEGVAQGLYRFEPIDLKPPHDQTKVWTYIYCRSTVNRPIIKGKWR